MTVRLDGGQLTPAQIVTELDRYVVGQGEGQARGRHRAPEPLAAPERAARAPGRGGAEEHHHDRPDRRGKDRDRPAARAAGPGAVPEGRGLQVHRGRLRRPRRRVDDPGPDRAQRQHGQERDGRRASPSGRPGGRGAPPRAAPAARPHPDAVGLGSLEPVSPRPAPPRARSCASSYAPAGSTTARSSWRSRPRGSR